MKIISQVDLSGLAKVTKGEYTGNDLVNRAIPHGLGVTPKLVMIWDITWMMCFYIREDWEMIYAIDLAIFADYAVTKPDATNFYVGNADSYKVSANQDTIVYNWVIIG